MKNSSRRLLTFLMLLVLGGSVLAHSEAMPSSIVAPAPDFFWRQGGKIEHLSSLRGKPVLLIIAPSPKTHALRSQLGELKDLYEKLAAQGMIACVAFTQEEGRVPSNVPFVVVLDGPATAAAYNVRKGFAVAVIGADGNLDCLSTRPLPGQRIHDLIDASYTTQSLLRRP